MAPLLIMFFNQLSLWGLFSNLIAVPLAFAQMTGKQITVPPDPELMGCFGVARLAVQKESEGLLEAGDHLVEALGEQPHLVGRGIGQHAQDQRTIAFR